MPGDKDQRTSNISTSQEGDQPPDHLAALLDENAGAGLSDDPRDHEPSGDEIDPMHGVAFDRPLFEQLLLSIIAAHPVGSRTPKQRLADAMAALVGKTHVVVPDLREDSALLWMTERAQRMEGKVPLSDRALAHEAVRKFFSLDPEQHPGLADRLRKKFAGTYPRRQGTEAVDVQRTLKYRALEHDYIAESVGAQSLRRVRDELAQWGITTKD